MSEEAGTLDRRGFLAAGSLSGAVATLALSPANATTGQATLGEPCLQPIQLDVNGRSHTLIVDTRVSLLDTLRDQLQLTGTKKGCDHGQCGACTVHINDKRQLACLSLAVAASGSRIATIEGVANGATLHPVQQAFIDRDAFQCGYCTPGQIMSALACITEGHANSAEDIREYMSGNLCRCAAYPNIVAAIQQAKAMLEQD